MINFQVAKEVLEDITLEGEGVTLHSILMTVQVEGEEVDIFLGVVVGAAHQAVVTVE